MLDSRSTIPNQRHGTTSAGARREETQSSKGLADGVTIPADVIRDLLNVAAVLRVLGRVKLALEAIFGGSRSASIGKDSIYGLSSNIGATTARMPTSR